MERVTFRMSAHPHHLQENIDYKKRIESIDLLRGVVILLMALDHIRDYFGIFQFKSDDVMHASWQLFMTRWITNLCAPTFIFLTGMSAYLYSLKVTKGKLSQYLVQRGLFLIFCEIFIVTWAWKFDLSPVIILQVIWAIGASMIALAGLIWLPRKIILLLSIAIIFGHNLLDHFSFNNSAMLDIGWHILHEPYLNPPLNIFNFKIKLAYPLLPWIAVMSLGYCFGPWLEQPVSIRCKKFFIFGMVSLSIFIMLKLLNVYGDSYHWQLQNRGLTYSLLSFLKVSKYPPSLLYILLNLGIITLLWPVWEFWRGASQQFVLTFGKVAMFFYLLHLPLIHLFSLAYWFFKLHITDNIWALGLSNQLPVGYHFNLSLVYFVWLLVIIVMYPLCVAYKNFKEKYRFWWLKYI